MGMLKYDQLRSFVRPQFSVLDRNATSDARSLPELVLSNAHNNPDHTFCVQIDDSSSDNGPSSTHVSFEQLSQAVEACCEWYIAQGSKTRQAWVHEDGSVSKSQPIALFLESGLTLLVHILALLTLNVPCVLLSIRLSPEAIAHIISKTGTSRVIVSPRTQHTASTGLVGAQTSSLSLEEAISFEHLLSEAGKTKALRYLSSCRIAVREDDRNVLILHSSGTTGLPKPIPLAHRYLLGYAGCHLFSEDEDESIRGLNLSTLPFFHGFGLLAPCLALSVGKPMCLLSPSKIPSAESLLAAVRGLPISSLMTVPSILEDITLLEWFPAAALDLKKLEFVVVGGGAIKHAVGEQLHAAGVSLLNHFGATELGALAPIFRPETDYDWRYLRLRLDLGLDLTKDDSQETDSRKLTGYPFAWDTKFELQDRLISNPKTERLEVQILGRKDDLIVLATGEKVLPHQMEQTLERHPLVRRAVVFGQSQFEVGVLIEPAIGHQMLDAEIVDAVWPSIVEANNIVDQHGRISTKAAVVIIPSTKLIPLSDKGVPQRQETYKVFSPEITAVYDSIDSGSQDNQINITQANIVETVRGVVQGCLPEHVRIDSSRDDADFFHLGMDSLGALRLWRSLSRASRTSLPEQQLPRNFVYTNPSINRLVQALRDPSSSSQQSSATIMQELAAKYTFQPLQSTVKASVLVTGAAGNLGCHLLQTLCADSQVAQVICLVRSTASNSSQGDSESNQEAAFAQRGIIMPQESLSKLRYISYTVGAPGLGLSKEDKTAIATSVTHVFHGAWPMDFKVGLASFEIQVKALQDLMELCRSIHQVRPAVRPRIIFASSIAAVGRYKDDQNSQVVPEQTFKDTSITVPMGYAEAKWVCEQVMESAHEELSCDIEPMIVRIGQLAGSMEVGHWNPKEHIPALIRASKLIGKMPDLNGTLSWLPIDVAAKSLKDLLLGNGSRDLVYHLENPVRQSWPDVLTIVERKLGLSPNTRLPFEQWLKEATASYDDLNNLVDFFEHDFLPLSSGKLVLSTAQARKASRTLSTVGAVSPSTLISYVESITK